MGMDYAALFTSHHIAVLHDWLAESGELFVDVDYPHSGGSGPNYFVQSLKSLRELMVLQSHPEIEISIFRDVMFPIRGADPQAILKRAMQEIPDHQFYQIVTPDPYPSRIETLADGKGHVELQRDILSLEKNRLVAVGIHPFDMTDADFKSLYGTSQQRLWFSVRKNLNSYSEYMKNPDKYRAAISAWLDPSSDDGNG